MWCLINHRDNLNIKPEGKMSLRIQDKAKHNIRRDVKQTDREGADHINPYMLASVHCMVVIAFKDIILYLHAEFILLCIT